MSFLISHTKQVLSFFALTFCVWAVAAIGATNPQGSAPAEVPEKKDVGAVKVNDPVVTQGLTALGRWDMAAADNVAEQLKREGKWDSLEALLFRSKLTYFHGDYAGCLKVLEELYSKEKVEDSENLRDRVKKLAAIMAGAKSFESSHFVIKVVPGPDEVLVNDTLAALEKSYNALTADLGVKPNSKVLVEVFPTFEALELATGLSEKDVETTNTVAVCKFARIMITTPRVLLRGYNYRDTISHELVHYLIFLKSGYNCPIWLHEGIARYEEKRWRMPEGGYLNPSAQSLLAAALKSDKLITFEEMNPSFAMLPSAEAGELAFSEVSMCVKYMVSRGGFAAVLSILDRLNKNPDWRKAIQAEFGEPFNSFLAKWKDFMRKSNLQQINGVDLVGVKLRKEGQDQDESDQENLSRRSKDDPAARYIRLGDLLRGQGRMKAALVEYQKALETQPNSVYLLNKTANILMMQGNFDGALPLLQRAEQLYPDSFPGTFQRLGIIYFAKEDYQKAKTYFEHSAGINPFDTEVQRQLLDVYSKLNMPDAKKETERKLALLEKS